MTFSHPDLLYLLWLVPGLILLGVYGHTRRGQIMDAFGLDQTLGPISRRPGTLARGIKNGLIIVTITSLIIALAGLHYGHTWERIERKGVSLVLALDCSRSMLASDITPNRLQRAKWEIRDLLARLQGDKVGLVAFAGTAFVQCPITLDYSGFELFLQALTPDGMPVGGTDLGHAIETAMQAFDPQDGSEKAIILITDGETTTGDPMIQAQQAAEQHIKIFCIGIGQPHGAPVPGPDKGFLKDETGQILLSKLDETTLEAIAALTGGTSVRSTTGDMDLDTIYNQEIRGGMKAATLTGGKHKTSVDRYAWLLGLGLIALLAEGLILSPGNALFGLCLVMGLVTVKPAQALDNPFITHEGRGMAAYADEAWEQAGNHFLKALVDNPDDPSLAYNLGNTAFRAAHYEDAVSFFTTAATATDPTLRHKALYNRGNALFRLNKYEEALASYEQAVQLAPKDQATQDNIAFVKKILEQQKQDKENKQNQESNDHKDKPGSNDLPKDASGQQDQSGDKKRDPQEQQPKDHRKPNNHNKQNNNLHDQKKNAREDGNATPPAKAQPQPKRSDDRSNQGRQASPTPNQSHDNKMLHRLKDHPGKALIPRYEPRNVQRDW